MDMRKTMIGVGLVGSTFVGGAVGAALFAGSSAGAATTTTTTATAPSTAAGADRGNSDPAHEAAETPEREAAEANGDFGPGPGGVSNHDAAHEAAESPERAAEEAARDAANAGRGTATTAPTSN